MKIDIVKNFFDRQEWQYSQISDKNILFLGISGENGKFQCVADLVEDEKQFMFFSILGSNVPSEKRVIVDTLLNELNYEIFLGNFEMNPENGEVRFKTTISYKNLSINESFIEELISTNIATMDSCLPKINKSIYGD